jgi:outer membrane protein OmpA-like peptidoglycan-associated protein
MRPFYPFLRLLLVFVSLSQSGFSQEYPCELPKNKKAENLFEEAKKEKLSSKRRELLKQVVDMEPEHYPALYEFAYENIRLAEKNIRMDYKFAADKLKKVIEMCPKFHPYPYYFLGSIALGEKKYDEAVTQLNTFLEFRYEDDRAYPKDYETRRSEAEKMLATASFYNKLLKNPVPFDPKLVEGLSTKDDEYLAIVSPDNELCFFTRKSQRINKNSLAGSLPMSVEEFSLSHGKDGKFDVGEKLPPPFNLTDNVGGATVTVDNKTIYVTICKRMATGYYNCDIYESHLNEKEDWTEPQNLGPGVNGNNSFEGQASISADGKSLYFVSIRKDEIGAEDNMDLYVSKKDASGNWGKATNLGTTINTRGNEKSPFLHSDSQTLYFSSDSLPGMGGFDIFLTKQDETGKWMTPKNIGYPINTSEDDLGFFVSTDGQTAYFSSNVLKKAGGWDLYSFPLYKEARPEKIVFLKGELKNEANQPAKNARIEVKNLKTKEVKEIPVDSVSGKYVAVFSLKEDMMLTVKSEGAAFQSRYFSKKDTAEVGKPKQLDIEVKPVKKGGAYRIHDINFESNSWDLTEQCMNILTEFGAYLRENNSLKVAIHGHTDNVGNDGENLKLSENRAKAVYSFLTTLNIEASRLSYKGFGETKPLAGNDSEAGRAQNRRTEFVILSE